MSRTLEKQCVEKCLAAILGRYAIVDFDQLVLVVTEMLQHDGLPFTGALVKELILEINETRVLVH